MSGPFVGLSRAANSSKQALGYAEWTMYRGGASGHPLIVEPLFRTQMTYLEASLEGRIQHLIDLSVKANLAAGAG